MGNGNSKYNKENLLTGLKINLDFKLKLYFQASEALTSTLKFIAGFYGAFLTFILTLLNFSRTFDMNSSQLLYFVAFLMLITALINNIGKSFVLELFEQYGSKEVLFMEIDSLKNTLDSECGLKNDENYIYSQKYYRIVRDVSLTYITFNTGLAIVSTFVIYGTLVSEYVPYTSHLTIIFSIISLFNGLIIYKTVNSNRNEFLEIAESIYEDNQLAQKK
ncbi:hypothetical protein [Methanococcus maripaludis]|uniref:Cytochrome c biogenesis protein CcdA n=1 Tax=Methanococcus maripaludis TaxID=39152 RepID=A0A8T4CJV9_METMI|nr:hypothetical protein [Methanococcus maripaludis]MBM7408647.1 cytochrome c biogenesis protein CcdA [Methanococcus maripaludis]MBP2219834.1 cytochrome c biogenesis protein CcdA [Methanococcus maripaludis]